MCNFLLFHIILVFSSLDINPVGGYELQTNEAHYIQEMRVSELEPERQYCFVKEIFKKEGTYYLIADYIEYLTDDEAIEKAREQNMADYDITKEGDTVYFVFNDYYVSNVNPKLRTLELSGSVTIEMLDYQGGLNEDGYRSVKVEYLINRIKSSNPILILSIDKGVIIGIKQQFTP